MPSRVDDSGTRMVGSSGTRMEERLQRILGERVRSLREGTGLSQEDFARRANLSRGFYARVERGEENPTWIVLARIAGGLDMQLGDVFDGVELDLKAVRAMPARRRTKAPRGAIATE